MPVGALHTRSRRGRPRRWLKSTWTMGSLPMLRVSIDRIWTVQRLLLRDQAELHLHADVGMVGGQPANAAILDQIRPAIADVADGDLVVAEQGDGQASCPCGAACRPCCPRRRRPGWRRRTSGRASWFGEAPGRPSRNLARAVSTASRLATSPSSCPPMPSAMTASAAGAGLLAVGRQRETEIILVVLAHRPHGGELSRG